MDVGGEVGKNHICKFSWGVVWVFVRIFIASWSRHTLESSILLSRGEAKASRVSMTSSSNNWEKIEDITRFFSNYSYSWRWYE